MLFLFAITLYLYIYNNFVFFSVEGCLMVKWHIGRLWDNDIETGIIYWGSLLQFDWFHLFCRLFNFEVKRWLCILNGHVNFICVLPMLANMKIYESWVTGLPRNCVDSLFRLLSTGELQLPLICKVKIVLPTLY